MFERVGMTDYRIRIGKSEKVYHIYMLKKYFESGDSSEGVSGASKNIEESSDLENVAAAVIEDETDEDVELMLPGLSPGGSETVKDVHISSDLSEEQQQQWWQLVNEFQDIFSDRPGEIKAVEHRIRLTDDNPICSKPYPVPHAMKEVIKEEVKEMKRLGVIEPSNSPYASPLLIVKKKDGSNRPVVDFRRLNKVTVFDAEPMPSAEDIYARLSSSQYFSKMDFCKGYWQIPMAVEDRAKTVFSTPFGLYQFTRMPFGLQNACATYGRMMRLLLDGMQQADNFVDDVISFTDGWIQHLQELRELFERVRGAGLTVKPSKCYFGHRQVDFVGHTVGQGSLRTKDDKVERIVQAPVPKTKTQLRSYLGLAGYYRRFVPSYATVAAPLTDLLRKGAPNNLEWGAAQESAFQQLKGMLASQSVLRLPDQSKQFLLRTDASDLGLGAVLL